MTRIGRLWRDWGQAGSMNALMPVHAAVDRRTFQTKGGQLLTVLSMQSVDAECLDPGQMDHVARRFEAAARIFDEPFTIYQYHCKRSDPEIPARVYDNPVLREAVANRSAYLKSRGDRLYAIDNYLVIAFDAKPQTRSWLARVGQVATDPATALRRSLSTSAAVAGLNLERDRASGILRDKVDSFILQLQDVLPLRVLDKHEGFGFFRRLLNYSPHKAESDRLKHDSFIDFFACDSTLECHRDHLRLDDHYVQVLTLKDPPGRTFPHLLRGLQEIAANYIVVTEWKRHSNATVRRRIQSMRRHFHNSKSSLMNYVTSTAQTVPQNQLVDDSAVAMVGDLGQCLEELEINGRFFGQFSLTVVLYDLDRTAVQRAVAECVKVFATHDGRIVEERYNALNAWISVLPGAQAYNLRRLWLLNTNHADLSFVFGHQIGESVNTQLGAEYLAVVETESRTPYFFNLHYQDTAHTMVLGAPGSGKSFLLNFLITGLQKYAPFTFIFDLGGSYEQVTRLFGGAYTAVGADPQSFAINPFSLPATPENRHFLASFCRVLIESGGYVMTSADERDLAQQIENVYAVEPDQRRLFTLANILGRPMRNELRKWVKGGSYAQWFDNAVDTVTLARFQAFDFEGLTDYPQVLEALVFFILHRATTAIHDPSLTTTFKVFVLDEAWRFFRHPAVKLYIITALKTWRKKNAAMILATQSVDDLRQSDLLPVVVESCATKLFLANPGMDQDAYRDIFHLNATEAGRIAGLLPKQQILIKRPDLAKVVNLNVDPKSYWLYTNNPVDNARKREVFSRHTLEEGLEILAGSAAATTAPAQHRNGGTQ